MAVHLYVPLHYTKTTNKQNHGKFNRNHHQSSNHLGNRNNLSKEMKTKVITAKEYARLSGLSPESGIISRRLREYEKTGTLREMPGVIRVKRHGYTWAIQVLMSWVNSKESENGK